MRTRRGAPRPKVRTALVAALLTVPSLASAETEGVGAQVSLPPLPPQVAEEARAAADRALGDPDLVANLLRARRHAVRAGRQGIEWSVDHGWRVGWDGGSGFDVSLSLEVPILDPALARDAAEAAVHLDRARLDASLHLRSAAEELVQARIALWRARTIAERLDAARELVPRVRGEAAQRLLSLLDHRPTARFQTSRLEAALARATAGGTPAPLGAGAWDGVPPAPAGPCVEGAANVIRARADVAGASRRATARKAAARPTVRAGASGGLRQAELGAGPVDLTGRVWLRIGMPRSWSVAGTVRTEVDAHGAEARISVRGPDADGAERGDEVRSARRALERARFEAHDDAAYRRHELARTEARLAALGAEGRPVRPVDALEHDLELVELRAARSSLLATIAFACAWNR